MSPWGWNKKQWKIKFKSVYVASHYVLIDWRSIDLLKSLVKLMSVHFIPLIFIIHHVPFPSTTNNWELAVFLQNIKEKKKTSKEFGFPQKKAVLVSFSFEIQSGRKGQLKIQLWKYNSSSRWNTLSYPYLKSLTKINALFCYFLTLHYCIKVECLWHASGFFFNDHFEFKECPKCNLCYTLYFKPSGLRWLRKMLCLPLQNVLFSHI